MIIIKHINLNKYTYYQFRYTYKHFIKKINALENVIKQQKQDRTDTVADLYKTLQYDNQVIKKLVKQLPKHADLPKEQDFVLSSLDTMPIPPHYSIKRNDGLKDNVGAVAVKKNHHYIITAHSSVGQELYISQYSVDMADSVFDRPDRNTERYVQFIGKNQDQGDSESIRLEFKSLVSGVLYLVPAVMETPITDFKFIEHGYYHDDPDFPNDEDIPVPNSSAPSKKQSRLDKKTAPTLITLAKRIRNGAVNITHFTYKSDENGNVDYNITASPVLKEYPFLTAMNQLDNYKGIKRNAWKKDVWVELDTHGTLVKKYRGNDQMFPYQPTKKDLDATDWVVQYVRPFNPNTKPNGSDPYDDSTDTDNYGFDGSFLNHYDD